MPNPYLDGATVTDLPSGYAYRVTRYADLILRDAFSDHYEDVTHVLNNFQASVEDDIDVPGGNRSSIADRFDSALGGLGWGKKNFDIETTIDGESVARVRSHEIDMFKLGDNPDSFPGVAVEMEWNNKDPFFDRDLTNYYALHKAGALAVGIIVTRGPELQRILKPFKRGASRPYGESSTHWNKLTARVNLGGGGECPMILIGIEPPRVLGIEALVT